MGLHIKNVKHKFKLKKFKLFCSFDCYKKLKFSSPNVHSSGFGVDYVVKKAEQSINENNLFAQAFAGSKTL